MVDLEYLFEYVIEKMAYDCIPDNNRTTNIHRVHGTTFIFNVNTYSIEIKPEPPPHSFEHTILYSIIDNSSSKLAISTLRSTPQKNPVNVRAQINSGHNHSITSHIHILHM